VVRLLLIAAALSGCYHPTYVDCTVLCGAANDCPEGLTCQDGFCVRAQPSLVTCAGGVARELAAGPSGSCVARLDHTLWCWGVFPSPSPSALPQFNWQSVALGGAHGCALATGGALSCWGANDEGQLGDGTTDPEPSPVPVGQPGGWVTLGLSDDTSCGTRSDGTLWCWGRDLAPQPTQVSGVADAALVVLGGTQRCWLNHSHILTCGSLTRPGEWISATIGGAASCGLHPDGTLECWLGSAPAAALSARWQMVSCGARHCCGLDTANQIQCWGENDHAQLGVAETTPAQPTTLPGDDWFIVRAGDNHTCGEKLDGSVWCWGDDRPPADVGLP
jgi:hypothetical protein